VNAAQRANNELKKKSSKRSLGGDGDLHGFAMLCGFANDDIDLFEVELPEQIKCSTCKFLSPDFHEKMACWGCVLDGSLPKWRSRRY